MRKIFFIDNLNSIIDLYSDFLSLKGYKIAVATSVEDFMKRHYTFNPDLIIYDTDMPRKESSKFSDFISTFPSHLSTPVLFLTGFINESKLRNFKNIENSSFLSKNSSNVQVLKRIIMLMDKDKDSSELQIAYGIHSIEQPTALNR
ncbi:MAG: response regulator [Thermodesulfobacteriota bacterium]